MPLPNSRTRTFLRRSQSSSDCPRCGASSVGSFAVGISDLGHDCREREDRDDILNAEATRFSSGDLIVEWVIWGGDAAEHHYLSDLVREAMVLTIDTVEYLKAV